MCRKKKRPQMEQVKESRGIIVEGQMQDMKKLMDCGEKLAPESGELQERNRVLSQEEASLSGFEEEEKKHLENNTKR